MTRIFDGTGRPTLNESTRRRAKWLALVADGTDPVVAAREAHVDLGAMLRVACRPGFEAVVAAVKQTGEPQAFLVVGADTEDLAA